MFRQLQSIEVTYDNMKRANTCFEEMYKDFSHAYHEHCGDDFFIIHAAHVLISRYGQDLPMPLPTHDDDPPSEDVARTRQFFNDEYIRWQECDTVSLALATTFTVDWGSNHRRRPRCHWTTEPDQQIIHLGVPLTDPETGQIFYFEDPHALYDRTDGEGFRPLTTEMGTQVQWFDVVYNEPRKNAGTLVDLDGIEDLFNQSAARTDDNLQTDHAGRGRRVPVCKYPVDCTHTIGSIQAKGPPGVLANALDMLNWDLNQGNPMDVKDRFVKCYGTQLYNELSHVMRGGARVNETSQGHMTAVSAGEPVD